MDKNTAINIAKNLVNSSKVAMVGSIELGGFPNIKAMLNMEAEGLKTLWFSTNTSSKRVVQFKENPKSCIYFANESNFMGLMLIGEMEVLDDRESRMRLWRDGFEMYYPKGIDDPDYTVLRFTACKGNLYTNLSNIDFEL